MRLQPTTFNNWYRTLDENTRKVLSDLRFEAGSNEVEVEVGALGRATLYLDECSEGEDRGGYVAYLRFANVLTPQGHPLTLEENPSDGTWLFDGRSSVLRDHN